MKRIYFKSNVAHEQLRSSLPGRTSLMGMSPYNRDETKPTFAEEQNPHKIENEAHHLRRIIAQLKHTNAGDALQE